MENSSILVGESIYTSIVIAYLMNNVNVLCFNTWGRIRCCFCLCVLSIVKSLRKEFFGILFIFQYLVHDLHLEILGIEEILLFCALSRSYIALCLTLKLTSDIRNLAGEIAQEYTKRQVMLASLSLFSSIM